MKLYQTLIFVIIWVASLTFVSEVQAVSCSSVPISGNYTVSSSCEFSGTVDGVDTGSGTTNTATITVNSGQTLTISASQTVVFGGSITINGSISIVNTGQIRQTALWMTDADTDNYPSSTTQTAQSTTPTSGRRRNLMTSISSTDCNDTSGTVYQNLTCYTDNDNDEYGVGGGSSVCSGASCGTNLADVATDCYDSNANARPNQTSYFTTNRGDGSFDYDCNSTADIQYDRTNGAGSIVNRYDIQSGPCSQGSGWYDTPTVVTSASCGTSASWGGGSVTTWDNAICTTGAGQWAREAINGLLPCR